VVDSYVMQLGAFQPRKHDQYPDDEISKILEAYPYLIVLPFPAALMTASTPT
jgi:hypothetical protein